MMGTDTRYRSLTYLTGEEFPQWGYRSPGAGGTTGLRPKS
ncbi:hypothetical protein C7S13_7388 [Burkholderia cepacia]|nr:hypothetical protein [Burkholderia cepacia]